MIVGVAIMKQKKTLAKKRKPSGNRSKSHGRHGGLIPKPIFKWVRVKRTVLITSFKVMFAAINTVAAIAKIAGFFIGLLKSND